MHAARRFVEFFTANISNRNTREAYSRNIGAFLAWCEIETGLALGMIEPMVVAACVEKLLKDGLSKPTVKHYLAAIRMMFDWMVTGGILAMNPASAARGPKYVIKKGKTPVLTPEEARPLLDSIDITDLKGLHDGIASPSGLQLRPRLGRRRHEHRDYYQQGKRWWLRLHEKGSKHHEQPVHHKSEEYLDAYLRTVDIADQKGAPLWRSMTKERELSDIRMNRQDVFRMIKWRCREAELGAAANCHTFRRQGLWPICSTAGHSSTPKRSPPVKARGPRSSTTAHLIK